MAATIPRERSLIYLQLNFFKLREYCVQQGFLKRTRRLTPVGAASKKGSLDICAAEDISFRMFGQVLRSIFDGCQVVKQRNMAEFKVKLEDGDWWRNDRDINLHAELQFHPSLSPHHLSDDLRQFLILKMMGPWGRPRTPHLIIGIDGRPGSSRYYNRRREDTLLKNGRSVTDFHSAMRAVVEWKRLMDARIEAVRIPAPEPETPTAEECADDYPRDITAQAAFEEAARRMTNERQQDTD